MTYRLELRNITKSFGEVKSLRNVTMHVDQNEIVGLLGDNGAGKSTLIKIITGYHQPDTGELFFNGKEVKNLTVPKARDLGEQQTLWRNIFLGRELTNRFGLIDVEKMVQETNKLMIDSMGFTSGAV